MPHPFRFGVSFHALSPDWKEEVRLTTLRSGI